MPDPGIRCVVCMTWLLATGGCKAKTDSSLAGRSVAVDGSSTVAPVTKAIAYEFHRGYSANVDVAVSGTGGGFRKFCAGSTDISNASRPINAAEADECRRSGIQYVELPIGYDGIAVLVNPRNTWANEITTEELKRIWEPAAQGTITRWSQVREGWPDRELHLYGPGPDSGTFDYFTEAIVHQQHASRTDYSASEDDEVLVRGIANDELALGYFSYVYYHDNRTKLKALAVDDGKAENGAGPILPSPETVRSSRYQPLGRPFFLYVSVHALGREEVDTFTRFYLTRARRVSEDMGYVPLPDSAYELARQRLSMRRPGSVFTSHDSQIGVTIEALLAKEKSE